ncbi:MAG: hypothetical protein HY537_11210 [Deltaproteobacteria bacterium]|nr:hypothetical protein [Deltaproteobacteria bacterium]
MEPTQNQSRITLLTAVGAILSALLASTCCILPIIVAVAGIGTVGAGVLFEKYRFVFVLATYLLLGLGFYFSYRNPDCDKGTCAVSKNVKRTRGILWVATAIATLGILFPYYVGWLF